ncbi:nuclear transport factor 2 family protein [Amycolatopsis cynarae]|uniref:Nuclear transport factor 2 family protein n=1 Tax=Amycolatopsis cynarae TaxID=2995223 RepID=A0ABY7BBT7_9PSEU|nr:nuclear transport factor 2 family protein [Amycolatopsis sp. HUAS 11-8]WAL68341.1 nuclear transport factor 2 family protein [Amycolatopsis sp. HUAS 11-8]
MSIETTLKRFYAEEAAYVAAGGFGNASFDGLASCLAEDVVMYQAESLPYGGQWRGHEGIEQFMFAFGKAWESLEFFEHRFVTEAPSVVVYNRGRLRARCTGRTLDTSVMQLITVRDGLIAEMHPFYMDTAAVLEALAHVS